LLDDLGDRRYSHLKEEALDRIKWRNRFGRGCGPVVWQITYEWWIMYICMGICDTLFLSWISPTYAWQLVTPYFLAGYHLHMHHVDMHGNWWHIISKLSDFVRRMWPVTLLQQWCYILYFYRVFISLSLWKYFDVPSHVSYTEYFTINCTANVLLWSLRTDMRAGTNHWTACGSISLHFRNIRHYKRVSVSATLPTGKEIRYPFYRRFSVPQSWFRRSSEEKISVSAENGTEFSSS
jgi:hypothetical protein